MKDELLSRAAELIEQRVSQIQGQGSGPRVARDGFTLSIDGDPRPGDVKEVPVPYSGEIQVQGARVRVAPFCIETYSNSYWTDDIYEEASIGGISLYSTSRPSFSRISGGGAIFLEKTWELYVEAGGVKTHYVSSNLLQQSLTSAFPRSPGEVTWPYGGSPSVTSAATKTYSLIGVYLEDGTVLPSYLTPLNTISSFTDPFDGYDSPHIISSHVAAPYTVVRTL